MELMKREQVRIDAEVAHAEQQIALSGMELERGREVIKLALRVFTNCQRIYRKSPDENKRKFNQAVFERVFVTAKQVSGYELKEPFAMVDAAAKGSNKERLVEQTHHNANHLDLRSDQVEVAWSNRFYEPVVSAQRSGNQKKRHAKDPAFHKASLEILKQSREARFWSEDRILEALRDFHARTGRAPSYYDFRKTKELPDYTTLWKRFGSLGVAISRAFDSPS